MIATASAPLIIGATGGSGTRVVARIAQRGGYDLGQYVNEANDALAFRSFHDRWINRFLNASKGGETLGGKDREHLITDFRLAVNRHLGSRSADQTQWGWKAPRSVYLLPFLRTEFPNLKFIHVLRDGRDMAFSKNQNQLRKHGGEILTWSERVFSPQPVRSILLWSRINLRAAEVGEVELGENYCVVRFEDLCQKPVETTGKILRFLDIDLDPESIADYEILAPASIGRWRRQSPRLISKITAAGDTGLRKFGYI